MPVSDPLYWIQHHTATCSDVMQYELRGNTYCMEFTDTEDVYFVLHNGVFIGEQELRPIAFYEGICALVLYFEKPRRTYIMENTHESNS